MKNLLSDRTLDDDRSSFSALKIKKNQILKERHENTKSIRETLTIHSFIPISTDKALIEQYSASDE